MSKLPSEDLRQLVKLLDEAKDVDEPPKKPTTVIEVLEKEVVASEPALKVRHTPS